MIDRNAGVTPSRYADSGLRKAVGELIGRADRDDMLRALILVSECRMAQDIGDAWAAHAAMLEREVKEAKRRADGTKQPPGYGFDTRNPVDKAAHQASNRLREELTRELREAREAHQECVSTLEKNTYILGYVPAEPASGSLLEPDLLDAMAVLRDQLRSARQRVGEIMDRDRADLHDLAFQEEYRRSSAGAEAPVRLRDIDRMAPGAFADLVEQLLRRDGYPTHRPAAARAERMITANVSGGPVTFFAHRVDGSRGSAMAWAAGPAGDIGTPDLHRMHRLAAQCTDQPLVVVTNGGFSRPAQRYAAQHGIGLLGRDLLLRWAEWQEPLDVTEPSDQNAA
ncbi:restriction endonuclease [Streptomyces sp. URMC 127]|uniref:restriction endonuclease n=1 Tax=Streptomyces sp. URMC 127 TaxID=3423402 RepID=UPI003F1A4FD0